MSTQSNPLTETGNNSTAAAPVQRKPRGFQPGNEHAWRPGQSGNAKGRHRGILSRATLKELRSVGDEGEAQIRTMVKSLIDKASGKGLDGVRNPEKASLAAFELVHNMVDGPVDRTAASDSTSSGAQVMVIVQDVSNGAKVVESKPSQV